MGKALLAFSPPGMTEAVIARGLVACTPYTLTSGERLRKALAAVRIAKIAVSRWELAPGESAVAVPVFYGGGNVVAALELSVRDLRNDLRSVQAALHVAGRSLSRELVTSQPAPRPVQGDRRQGVPPIATIPSARPGEVRLADATRHEVHVR